MNDFELSYLHYARSRELMAEAERHRRAVGARKSADGAGREGLASRLAKALNRRRGAAAGTARRLHPAK